MNSYVNMAVGALLGTVFVVLTVSIVSEGLFHSEVPEKPGYAIVAEEGGEAGSEPAAEVAAVPIATLLATADPAKGQAVFKKCTSCHNGEKGAGNKVGPHLFGVVGRPVASLPDFGYSAGMKEFSEGGKQAWDFEHLNGFLTAPKKYVKGTAMGFAGIKNDADRANLIAWLNSNSDTPLPLPAKP